MKDIINYTTVFLTALFFLSNIFSCNNHAGSKKNVQYPVERLDTIKPKTKKPASTFSDTLIINSTAAVFYQPDSLQLSRIKAITEPRVYAGSMHEYFYQMRNARIVIRKNWPRVQIIGSAKYRYLKFIKKDKSFECIDLDTMRDTHGLLVFNEIKSPEAVDMTNIESILGFYFSNP